MHSSTEEDFFFLGGGGGGMRITNFCANSDFLCFALTDCLIVEQQVAIQLCL